MYSILYAICTYIVAHLRSEKAYIPTDPGIDLKEGAGERGTGRMGEEGYTS